jgi:hypothetical protein
VQANTSAVSEWLPNICVNGHRLVHPNADIAWKPCSCAPGKLGHRTVQCRTCGATWYQPPHTDSFGGAEHWTGPDQILTVPESGADADPAGLSHDR